MHATRSPICMTTDKPVEDREQELAKTEVFRQKGVDDGIETAVDVGEARGADLERDHLHVVAVVDVGVRLDEEADVTRQPADGERHDPIVVDTGIRRGFHRITVHSNGEDAHWWPCLHLKQRQKPEGPHRSYRRSGLLACRSSDLAACVDRWSVARLYLASVGRRRT